MRMVMIALFLAGCTTNPAQDGDNVREERPSAASIICVLSSCDTPTSEVIEDGAE